MNCKHPGCKYQIWAVGTDYCQPHAIQMYLETKSAQVPQVNYKEYLKSAAWRERALACKWAAGKKCQLCGRPDSVVSLEAHHNNYTQLGQEGAQDLTALCSDCHRLFGRFYQYDRELGYHVPS